MMAWPTVNQTAVVARYGPLAPEQSAVIDQRIKDAEAIVQWELLARGVTGTPDPDPDDLWATLYISTVCSMVIRYLDNPKGWVEETFAIDDYRETKRRGNNTAPEGLYILDSELNRLLPVERRKRGAFSIVQSRTP